MTEYIVKCKECVGISGTTMQFPEYIDLNQEIVRCRDCHWAKPDQSDHDYRGEYRCNIWIADVSADGYCWRGKRKEDGDD